MLSPASLRHAIANTTLDMLGRKWRLNTGHPIDGEVQTKHGFVDALDKMLITTALSLQTRE